jgi:hypothetical protein
MPEAEACRTLTNDPIFSPGAVPGVPQAITVGRPVCGALVATDGNPTRNDVDVFSVNLAGLDTDGDGKVKVRVTLTAGTAAFAALVPPGSAAATLAASDTLRVNGAGCQPAMDWACRTPGTWWVVVAAGANGVIADAPTECTSARYTLLVQAEAACMTRCGASTDSCFAPHAGASCSDPACCAATCAVQPSCCDTGWDADCAIVAAATCGAPPPANDACANAATVRVGSTAFSMLGSTLDGPAVTGCGIGTTTSDVWFSFTPVASGETEITTCGTDFDTRLQVFQGGCGPGRVPMACNDDSPFCGAVKKASRVTVTVDCGNTYFIRVGGVAGATGFGTLNVGAPNGDPCCPGDMDASGVVDFGDIALILLDFGPCAACTTDLDASGIVDFGDVALALLNYGPCG